MAEMAATGGRKADGADKLARTAPLKKKSVDPGKGTSYEDRVKALYSSGPRNNVFVFG